MKAGFLNLFSRSLYQSGLSRLRDVDPESAEYKRVHEERERFAAETIAFCLEYDPDFLTYFWTRVCSKPADCRPAAAPEVEVEPARWADLLLTRNDILCAVEIKLGAPLAAHQNPNKREFSQLGGYGDFLSDRCRQLKCKGRYIILSDKLIEPELRGRVCGVEVGQRQWKHLASGWPTTRPLLADLIKLLSSFGVWEFTFEEMKNKKLSGKLKEVGDAIAILEGVRKSLDWPERFRVQAWRTDHWELGIYLEAYSHNKPLRGLAERLNRSNDVSTGKTLAWFGYLAQPETANERRCVYVYCSERRRKSLVERLNCAGFAVDEERKREGDDYCAVVLGGHPNLDDVSWFRQALESAA